VAFTGVASFPETWRGRLLAALLWAGPEAFVSHRSAAALYGLDGFPEGSIEITAPYADPVRGVKVHRSKRPAKEHELSMGSVSPGSIEPF
jgi:hypothetical protein